MTFWALRGVRHRIWRNTCWSIAISAHSNAIAVTRHLNIVAICDATNRCTMASSDTNVKWAPIVSAAGFTWIYTLSCMPMWRHSNVPLVREHSAVKPMWRSTRRGLGRVACRKPVAFVACSFWTMICTRSIWCEMLVDQPSRVIDVTASTIRMRCCKSTRPTNVDVEKSGHEWYICRQPSRPSNAHRSWLSCVIIPFLIRKHLKMPFI